ncbi:MAG: Clp1/GlmU family protein [Candidatus Korarchaeum sp.]
MMEVVEVASREGILVRTPVSVRVTAGEAEVWGAHFDELDLKQEAMDLLITAKGNAKLELTKSDYLKIDNPIPEWWDDILDKLIDKLVIFIGRTDSGKSSSILYISNKLLSRGERVSLVDCDIGQSDLGPPGVISSVNLEHQVYQIKMLEPEFMYFLGDKSPRGHLLQMLIGVQEAMRGVRERTVLVNTTGFVDGAAARTLKRYKLEALNPDLAVFIERSEGELEHLVRSIPKGLEVIRVRSPVKDTIKDRNYRSLSRKASLRKYLCGGFMRTFDIGEVDLENTFLLTGEEKGEYSSFLSDVLGSDVVWVEESPDMLLILTEGHVDRMKSRELGDLLRKEVRYAPKEVYENLYVGLKYNRRCSGVGILRSLDLRGRRAEVLTKYGGQVDAISLGFIRLTEEGEELGTREVDSP